MAKHTGITIPPDATTEVRLTHAVRVPDKLKLARCTRAPEYGPRILFFSGGTALNPLSRRLTRYTHNSIHLITAFDSGGSSARLRSPFGVLGVGDFRSRLLALADQSVKGQAEIFNLLSYRLPQDERKAELKTRLESLVDGQDPSMAEIMDPMRKLLRNHLGYFLDQMPDDLDLRGASLGNLALVGGYLNNARDIEPAIFLFAKLIEARGIVRPIVDESLYLAAELEDGTTLVGQHLITGKEVPPIRSPIEELYLVDDLYEPRRAAICIDEKIRRLISKADLICYPMGSFYTSVVANFLPEGVGAQVAANGCPKVYVPNTGVDPEQYGTTLTQRVEALIRYLRRSGANKSPVESLMNFLLVDSRAGVDFKEGELNDIRGLGVEVIDLPLVTPESAPYLDEEQVISVLLSLV
jgi:CofD-related protein of GAK system